MGFKPSSEEQKWAKRQELDIREKLKEFISRHKSQPEIDIGTTCPADGKPLEKIEIDSTGVFVDKCTYCGGIWVSRGNMEKLIHSVNKTGMLVKYLAKIFNINI